MSTKFNFKPSSSWLVLGCITLLKTITPSGFVFSACSSLMKHHYHISHVQLNNLIVASETGRLFICFSASAAEYLPAWMILFIGLIFGSVGYGVQYFYIAYKTPVALTYWQVLLLNALAGNSTCWINTYCHLLAIRNFKDSHKTILAITSSYSLLSGKLYTSLVEGIQGRKGSQNSRIYLLLTCLAPPAVGLTVALINVILKFIESKEMEALPIVFVIAISTGVYAVIESVAPSFTHMSPQLRAVILVLVLMLPFAMALLVAANQFSIDKYQRQVTPVDFSESKSKRVIKELEIAIDKDRELVGDDQQAGDGNQKEVLMLGHEHGLKELVMNVDFWLFYMVNACGATLVTVYFNNLEQISESRGEASLLLSISSTFRFFGKIFSIMLSWYTREKSIIPNPALTVLLMIPMPVAVFVLMDSNRCLYISTGILGTCSGALNAISALTTYELFSCKNSVVKQTIFLTNIPLGSLLFGCLAALNYEKEGSGNPPVCVGLQCYYKTFIVWGSVCFIGTILSFLLHLRTHNFYLQKA